MKNLQSHQCMLLAAALLCAAGCGGSDPEERSSPWEGHTYQLVIDKTSWSEPKAVGQDIGDYVPHFAIRVEGSSGDQLDVLMGVFDAEQKQDQCSPTTAVRTTAKPYPGFELGPVDFPAHIVNAGAGVAAVATIYDLKMSNVLPDGATPAEEGTFEGTMDVREVYTLFTQAIPQTPDGICTTMVQFGAECAPCPANAENADPYCLTLKAQWVGATELDSSLEPIAAPATTPESCLVVPVTE